jgi:hypothetical protein
MQPKVGRTLGPYEVIERIALGGMAAVYRARQPSTDREVALKVLPADPAADAVAVARFEREARMLANLQHPHILPVFDFGRDGDWLYFVTPLLRHGDLADHLARWGEALPLADVRRILLQLCDALDHAHEAGIVHRDLKPANVLLDARGNCLLSDFGIARFADTPGLTMAGMVVGTPAYMSPEQGSGQAVDARSDIYALGVIAYELCAGRPPYRATTPADMLRALEQGPPTALDALNPAVPPALATAIARAMARDPADRYVRAADFGAAIAAALPSAGVGQGASASGVGATRVMQAGDTVAGGVAVDVAPPPARRAAGAAGSAEDGAAPAARSRPMAWIAAVLALAIVSGIGWFALQPDTAIIAEPGPAPIAAATLPRSVDAGAPAPAATPGGGSIGDAAPAAAPSAPSPSPSLVETQAPAFDDFDGADDAGRWRPTASMAATTVTRWDGLLRIDTRTRLEGVYTELPDRYQAERLRAVAARVRLDGPVQADHATAGFVLSRSDRPDWWLACYVHGSRGATARTPVCREPVGDFLSGTSGEDTGFVNVEARIDAARGRIVLRGGGVELGAIPLVPTTASTRWYLALTAWSGDGAPVAASIDRVDVE